MGDPADLSEGKECYSRVTWSTDSSLEFEFNEFIGTIDD